MQQLQVNVFGGPAKEMLGERPRPFGPAMAWDPMTATLIFGQEDAVLVDAMTTQAEAEAVAAWVELHHRRLTTIYITHGHLDHFAGLSVLLTRFPDARAIATPETVALAAGQLERAARYRRMWPGRLPASLTVPEPSAEDSFHLEGHELRIIRQGHTDAPDSTSLHVPSLGLVVAGDVVYNRCHLFVAGTTEDSRRNWIDALDRLEALKPAMVVAGHKKPGAADGPETIALTRQYLLDFDRERITTGAEEALFDRMGELYPDWVSHQAWLMFGL